MNLKVLELNLNISQVQTAKAVWLSAQGQMNLGKGLNVQG